MQTAIGAAKPNVLVLVDKPELGEIRKGEPFSSLGHVHLRNAIRAADIPLNICQFRYASTHPFFAIEKAISIPKGTKPAIMLPDGLVVMEELRAVIEKLAPTLIVAAGPFSQFAVTGRWGQDKWRGSIVQPTWAEDESQWVMPVLAYNRCAFTDTHLRHTITMDLRKAARFLDKGAQFLKRNCITAPSFSEASSYLDYLYDLGMSGTAISFDIECKHMEMTCIGFAPSATEAICIPFVNELGNHYTLEHEKVLLEKIHRILTNKLIRKIGQNLVFDTHFLLRKYGWRITNLDDTMIAQHTIMSEFPKGLDMICSLYTDIPYYKDDGKEWFKGLGTYEKLWQYNCLDALVCAEAFPKQITEIINLGQLPTYERQRSIIEPCVYMMEHGIVVDINRMKGEALAFQRRLEPLQVEFEALAPGVNPRSPAQLKQLFYQQLGHQEVKNKKGDVSTDVLAMKRLSAAGCRQAQLILEMRKVEKILSTYYNQEKFDEDGRVRCQYKPVGTAYSRLASAESFFGTGMNMQNWPHSALACLRPDPGYVCYSFDLSQAENRLVAYVGKITTMIEAFETGKDVHRLTAGLIFNKAPEDVSDEPGSSTIGGGIYSERDWGKRANHGLNYGFGAKAFSILYEIPIQDALRISDGYHSVYPGVQQGFHSYVKECLRSQRRLRNLMGRETLFLSVLDERTFQAAYSCIPQGTVGDMINERGMNYTYYNQHLFAGLELIGQVHDSIVFQLPLELGWAEHARMIQAIKDSLEKPLTTHYGRTFMIPADLAMGLTLQKESGLEIKAKKWPADEALLAAKLEENYTLLTEGQ